MKLNVKIIGRNVILVPYKEEHVIKYHEWMQSEELRHQTATPPLTLEQSYQMQKNWNDDENGCIFIILDKSIFDKDNNEVEAMVGETTINSLNNEQSSAEIDIMIVDSSANANSMGWEAISLMLIYGIQHLNIQTFEAKTSSTNEMNISWFTRLTFQEVSQCQTFNIVTYEKAINEEWTTWLTQSNPFELQTL